MNPTRPHEQRGFFKRSTYLYIFPFAIVAPLIGWFFTELGGYASTFDRVALPLMAACLSILYVAFWRSKTTSLALEIILFTSLAGFFLVRLVFALYFGRPLSTLAEELTEFTVWFPALYGLAFLSFGIERGRTTAFLYFGITVAAGAFYLDPRVLTGQDIKAIYTLSQMYLSNGVVIVIFVALGRLIQKFAVSAHDMEQIAHTDALTNISNRRELTLYLTEEIARSERYNSPFSLLLLDLDHFKRVNDKYGHNVGDDVLREFAVLLNQQTRIMDRVGRWGGEEFMVILPELSLEEATLTATRIRNAIQNHGFNRVGKLTVSIGLAEYQLGDNLKSIVHRTDGGLYRAKAEGRNRVASIPQTILDVST